MITETRQFRMHPQLLFDVIQRKAGTLTKAVLEGIMNAVDVGIEFHRRKIANWRLDSKLMSGEKPDVEKIKAIQKAKYHPTSDNYRVAILSAEIDGRGPINLNIFGGFREMRIMTDDRDKVSIDGIADAVELALIHGKIKKPANRNKESAEAELEKLKMKLAARLEVIEPNHSSPEALADGIAIKEGTVWNPRKGSYTIPKSNIPSWPSLSVACLEANATYSLRIEFDSLTYQGANCVLDRLAQAIATADKVVKNNFSRLKAPNRFPPKPEEGIG